MQDGLGAYEPTWLREARKLAERTATHLDESQRRYAALQTTLSSFNVDLAAEELEQAASDRREMEAERERVASHEETLLLNRWPELGPQQRCWLQVSGHLDGSSLSRHDRFAKGWNDDPHQSEGESNSFTYGEVSHFCLFVHLLREAVSLANMPCNRKPTFVDLGCGVGKAILAAALLPCEPQGSFFAKCIGIEVLPSLANTARSACVRLQQYSCGKNNGMLDCESEEERSTSEHDDSFAVAHTEVICGDVLAPEIDWSVHDVIFAASTCFTTSLIKGVLERARSLRPGSVLIMLRGLPPGSGNFPPDGFMYCKRGPYQMSWGPSMAHILVRREIDTSVLAARGLLENWPAVGPGLQDLD